jgi:hypothetical protein
VNELKISSQDSQSLSRDFNLGHLKYRTRVPTTQSQHLVEGIRTEHNIIIYTEDIVILSKVKEKLSLCLIKQHSMKIKGMEVYLHAFLT